MNFSEFKRYEAHEADDKLRQIGKAVKERAMPLRRGYRLLHPHSEITSEDEQAICEWISVVRAKENQL